MEPLSAASMEKGSPGLLLVKAGGSTRRKGEVEARRLEMAWRRLFFGDPRLLVMGVDLVELGDERALREDETEGVEVRLVLVLMGEVKAGKLAGLTNPASLVMAVVVLVFLVGLLKTRGSTFSESASSKISGARWRLPVDGPGASFKLCEGESLEMAM